MAQIIHGVRSDNSAFDARVSYGGPTPGLIGQNSAVLPPLFSADANAIGGNKIDMNRSATLARALVWNAMRIQTVTTSRAVSFLYRVRLGVNSAALGIGGRDGNWMNWAANRLVLFVNASNQWQVFAANEFGQTAINNINFGTQNVGTTDYVDLVFTWDGTTTANAVKFYINATLLGQGTATGALNATFSWRTALSLGVGGLSGANNCRMDVNEIIWWDYVIDPTAVLLTSGIGSLNGQSRTAFVDAAAFDALNSVDPGEDNVKSGTGYIISGVSKTGNRVDAPTANVEIGTQYGANGTELTGTYTGANRWSDPGESHVEIGTQYQANSLTNNRTGTYTGANRWSDPGENNVRDGVGYEANDVSKTGNLVLPAESVVEVGEQFGANGTEFTGTYTGANRWSDPGENNVRAGIVYKANSLTNNRVGSLSTDSTNPGVENVKAGVTYEINGEEFVGTYVPVLQPVNYGNGGVPFVGDAMDNWFQPMVFGIVVKTVVAGQAVETETPTHFRGVWQPFSARQLLLKPEGQRAWSWYWLHADPSLSLKVDDVVVYNERQYRVMAKKNYTLYGYIEYHLVTDWTGSGPEEGNPP